MPPRLKPLREQVMVITGASSGIGLATARRAASKGVRLVLASRSEKALRQLVAEIRARGGQAIYVAVDVGDGQNLRRVADAAVRTFGGVDTWINNAGVSVYGAALDVTMDDMRRVMETNFWGTVYGSRLACELLHARGGGALINVGSAVSDRAVPLQSIYSASKHAIKGWTDSLRAELMRAELPISVTLIKPGPIDTPYAEHARNYLPDQPMHVPPVYAPESVAEAILYAATQPVRDVYVGATARLIAILNGLWPGLADRAMAHAFIPLTHSGRPCRSRELLYRAGDDLRERGDYPGFVHHSVYTRAVVHPRLTTAIALGAGALMMVGWYTAGPRRARRVRPPRGPAADAS